MTLYKTTTSAEHNQSYDLEGDHTGIAALLIFVATVGMIGNFTITVAILILRDLRRASNAFLFHHCFLDFVKSGYCLAFAYSIISKQEPVQCNVLAGSYIVFVTASAFNLLALVMNESYQFTDLTLGIQTESRNYCCVIFGVFIIWFASFILNLGVAFIPGNPSYDTKKGHCIFIYGITRNYILHILWITLITMAILLTSMYLRKLHNDIKRSSYYRLSTLIRATVCVDTKAESTTQRRKSEVREKNFVAQVEKLSKQRLCLLMLLTSFFVTFWYPLFILTTVDPAFQARPQAYKGLSIFAWSNPAITPFICMFFIKKQCCCCPNYMDFSLTLNNRDEETLTDESPSSDLNGRRTNGKQRHNQHTSSYRDFGEHEDSEIEQLSPSGDEMHPQTFNQISQQSPTHRTFWQQSI